MYKVKVENKKQLDIALASKNVSEIILARDSFAECELAKLISRIKKSGRLSWIMLERISRFEEKYDRKINGSNERNSETADLRKSTDKIFEIADLDGIIIQNLDSFAYMLRKINKSANPNLSVELNYTINCYNDATKKVYQTLYNEKRNNAKDIPLKFTAPVELNIYELSEVGYDTMLVYSYIDTMVSANCLKKNVNAVNNNDVGSPICKSRFDFDNVQDFSSYIIDRKGKKLHYKTYCKYCYNKIFNTEPLYLLDKVPEIENISKFRLDFSFENENEMKAILQNKIPDSFTRGHFKSQIK